MKKIMNNLETLSFLVTLCILTICFIGSILVVYHFLTLKEYAKFILLFLPINTVLYILSKRKKCSFSLPEKLLLILVVITSLSVFSSINILVSLWGFHNRYEGLFMILLYYSIALLVSTIKDKYYKKMIVKYIVLIGLANFLYGLLQIPLFSHKLSFVKDSWKYARGFQGNSMYYASLMSICYFISLAHFILTKKRKASLIALMSIFTFASIISGSMALYCTIVFLNVLLLIYNFFKQRDKKRLLKIISCIFVFIIISFIFIKRDDNYKRDIVSLGQETKEAISNAKVEDSYGTGRIYIWKESLNKAKDNILFGVGVDNFYYAFSPRLIDPTSKYAVDKAHNDYLQKLVCEGIFSLIFYLAFLITIIVRNYNEQDVFYQSVFWGFVAYAIEIFFSISVIRVAPIFWIIIGILMSKERVILEKN